MGTDAQSGWGRGVGDVLAGARLLVRGFAFWARRPGLMALGLVPALIVGLVFTTLIAILAVNSMTIATWLSPFAANWDELWRTLLRILIAIALVVALFAISVVTFTAFTLTIGDPVYGHIWQMVEDTHAPGTEFQEASFWRSFADSLRLVGRAALGGIVLALVGLIPGIGSVLAFLLGVLISGRLLATELTTRAFEARGYDRAARRALLRRRPALVQGFGAAVHLCFLVPLGAVIVMPGAVAGATLLAHELLASPERVRHGTTPTSAPTAPTAP